MSLPKSGIVTSTVSPVTTYSGHPTMQQGVIPQGARGLSHPVARFNRAYLCFLQVLAIKDMLKQDMFKLVFKSETFRWKNATTLIQPNNHLPLAIWSQRCFACTGTRWWTGLLTI